MKKYETGLERDLANELGITYHNLMTRMGTIWGLYKSGRLVGTPGEALARGLGLTHSDFSEIVLRVNGNDW